MGGKKSGGLDPFCSDFVPQRTDRPSTPKAQKKSPKLQKQQLEAKKKKKPSLQGGDGGESVRKGDSRQRRTKGADAARLLGFHYESATSEPLSARPLRKPAKTSWQENMHNMHKFMQANFRFAIAPNSVEAFEASRHIGANGMVDEVDRHAHWDDIAFVCHEAPIADPVICPICLEPPTAAKITKCGHIFCWPCILHYLALSESNWRRCPVCVHGVYNTELKSEAIRCQASSCWRYPALLEYASS